MKSCEELYRLIGKVGNFDIDSPAAVPDSRLPMRFVGYAIVLQWREIGFGTSE